MILYGVNDYNSISWNKFSKEEIKAKLNFFDNFGKNHKNKIDKYELVKIYRNHCNDLCISINANHEKEIFEWFKKSHENAKFFVLRLLYDPTFEIFKASMNKIQKVFGIIIINDEILLLRNRSNKYCIVQGSVDHNMSPMESIEKEINEETCKSISINKNKCVFLNKELEYNEISHTFIFAINSDINLKEQIISTYSENKEKLHFANYNYHETTNMIFVKIQDIPKLNSLTKNCWLILKNFISKQEEYKKYISVLNSSISRTDYDNISTIVLE